METQNSSLLTLFTTGHPIRKKSSLRQPTLSARMLSRASMVPSSHMDRLELERPTQLQVCPLMMSWEVSCPALLRMYLSKSKCRKIANILSDAPISKFIRKTSKTSSLRKAKVLASNLRIKIQEYTWRTYLLSWLKTLAIWWRCLRMEMWTDTLHLLSWMISLLEVIPYSQSP